MPIHLPSQSVRVLTPNGLSRKRDDYMTQNERIEAALRKGPLTRLQAFQRFGCCNLWARISELKQRGLRITSERVRVRNRFGEPVYVSKYRLA